MRILFFSTYFYPYTSGITTHPLKILSYLANNNDITVLTFPHKQDLKQKESINKIKIIRLPYLIKVSKGFISPQSLFYFFKEVKKTDLIILNIPNFEGFFLAILGKIFNKKTVSLFHCQVFLKEGFFNKIIELFLNFSVKTQLKFSNKIVAYTKDYFSSLPISKKFIKKTVFILPPITKPIVDQNLLKEYLSKKKRNFWIGFSGRTAQEKGLEYLIEAFADLKLTNKELIFAGLYGNQVVGEEKYYLRMKKLLESKRIKYRFLGNLTNNQLGAFYKAIDVLVLPSINQTEAFGMVQPEAMFCGTPVIASNLPGVRIPTQLTKMGFIVPPKNAKKITQALNEILKNRQKFTNPFLIARAKKIFNINSVYSFYNRLLQ